MKRICAALALCAALMAHAEGFRSGSYGMGSYSAPKLSNHGKSKSSAEFRQSHPALEYKFVGVVDKRDDDGAGEILYCYQASQSGSLSKNATVAGQIKRDAITRAGKDKGGGKSFRVVDLGFSFGTASKPLVPYNFAVRVEFYTVK